MSVLVLLGSLVMAQADDGLSLLQLQASKRHGDEEGLAWGGKPFFICEHVKRGFRSHCDPIKDTHTLEWAKKATGYVRDCSIVANKTGADTYNFDQGRVCEPLRCRSVDVKPGPPEENISGVLHNHSNITVYSMYCGLEWVTKNFTSDTCGKGVPMYLGHHMFPKPRAKACQNTFNFSNLKYNNLHSGGALVFENALPGVDVSITADHPFWPKKDHTGQQYGFAVLNLETGTNATFTLKLLGHNTNDTHKVGHAMLTVAELTASRGCWNKMFVTANKFAGYYVPKDPKIDVKAFAGDEETDPYVTFMAAHRVTGAPKNGTLRKKDRAVSASIYYTGISEIVLKLETFDKKWRGGSILRLGGQPMVRCLDK